jgi:hypothetical protein
MTSVQFLSAHVDKQALLALLCDAPPCPGALLKFKFLALNRGMAKFVLFISNCDRVAQDIRLSLEAAFKYLGNPVDGRWGAVGSDKLMRLLVDVLLLLAGRQASRQTGRAWSPFGRH